MSSQRNPSVFSVDPKVLKRFFFVETVEVQRFTKKSPTFTSDNCGPAELDSPFDIQMPRVPAVFVGFVVFFFEREIHVPSQQDGLTLSQRLADPLFHPIWIELGHMNIRFMSEF